MDFKAKDEWLDITGSNQSDLVWCLRRYDCPNYIFAEDYDRERIKNEILKTHRIKDAIEKYKKESGVDANTAFKEAAGIIDEISHAFSISTIRFMSLLLIKITRSLFRHVLVNKKGIEMFRECVKLTPIVLVPTHNSYFDFLLASFVCFTLDLPLPAIVSGQDFLNMAIVNRLLRGSGAFYMRRSFASDNFYKSLFTEYTQRILCSGERPVEFFPEGTRSRCGKALQPKLGLLSMVLESFFHGYIQDVAFIPISISYEKITEEQLYLFELLGIPKPKESLSGLVKARSVLSTDFGTVSVHFGKPMYLKEYCLGKIDGTEYVNIPRCERHLKIFGRESQEMNVAKSFGEKVVFTQQTDMVIFPRAVVSSILLHKKEIPLSELGYAVDKIGKLLLNLNGKLLGFHDIQNKKDEVIKAVSYSDIVLGIDAEENVVCRYNRLEDVGLLRKAKLFEIFKDDIHLIAKTLCYVFLSAQRNKLTHSCILPSLLILSLKENGTAMKCEDGFRFLWETFKMEFIFDPDITVHESFVATMNKLTKLELITNTEDVLAYHPKGKVENEFLVCLLQPFIDAYLIIMHCLLKNTFEFPLSLKSITSELQLQSAELVKLTHSETFESLSLHTLSNCVTSLCKRKLLSTVKNSKFETLVNSVNREYLTKDKQSLAQYATTKLRLFTEQSRL